jgi:hypothetical protein
MLIAELIETAAMKVDLLRKRAELALLQREFPARACGREKASGVIVALAILAATFLMKHH